MYRLEGNLGIELQIAKHIRSVVPTTLPNNNELISNGWMSHVIAVCNYIHVKLFYFFLLDQPKIVYIEVHLRNNLSM